MLKKEFKRKDVNRMRNLITGKTGASTGTQIGYNKEQIELKMMTTKEEEILTNASYNENGIAIDKLLESIVLIDGFNSKDIFETDKLAMVIGSRIDAYGENYSALVTCEECNKEYDVSIDLNHVLHNIDESKIEKSNDGTLLVELPKCKKVVEFKVLLPSEMTSIEKTVEKMKSLNVNTSLMTEFYKRIIVSIDGQTDREIIGKFCEDLKIMDSRFLSSMYNKSLPNVNTRFTSACSHCNHEQEGGMPIQANFFFPEF